MVACHVGAGLIGSGPSAHYFMTHSVNFPLYFQNLQYRQLSHVNYELQFGSSKCRFKVFVILKRSLKTAPSCIIALNPSPYPNRSMTVWATTDVMIAASVNPPVSTSLTG